MEKRRITDCIQERVEIRSEVTGLVFELKLFKDRSINPVLVVRDHAGCIARLPLVEMEYDRLKEAFQKKDEPGCNFFDHVLTTVEHAVELKH